MSSCANIKSAKILVYDLTIPETKQLEPIVEHCPTLERLRELAIQYSAYSLIIAFNAERLSELREFLSETPFDAVYILNMGETTDGYAEPWWSKTTVVFNDKQLMRHLCTKSMLCFFNEGLEYRKNGDFGLANTLMLDSLRALDYSAKFI